MRLATIRTTDGNTKAVRAEADTLVDVGYRDVGELLARPDWAQYAAAADGERYAVSSVRFAPVVPRPGKVLCVGLNYRNHILEMEPELPVVSDTPASRRATSLPARPS